jgi:hypothetical protein
LTAGQHVAQQSGVEHVEAGVHFGQLQLVADGVAGLDDAGHGAGRIAHDTPVVRGLGEHRRGDGRPRGGGAVSVDEPLQELPVDERRVADQHDHVALEALERLEAGAHGVAGAQPLTLERALAARGQDVDDDVLLRARHDDEAFG